MKTKVLKSAKLFLTLFVVTVLSGSIAAGQDITDKMPRIERGEVRNTPPPEPKRQPSILERSPIGLGAVGPERTRPEHPKQPLGVIVTIPTK